MAKSLDISRLRVLLTSVVFATLGLVTAPANAVDTWYWGTVEYIVLLGADGSFQLRTSNTTITNNCLNQRVDFKVTDMGIERTKSAYAMALLALSTGKEWGVVVNMGAVGTLCKASSTAAQGAGIR